MASSRTFSEQAVTEPISVRGEDMDFLSDSNVTSDDVATPAAATPERTSKTIDVAAYAIVTDESRDSLLTEFGKDTLRDRYLLPGETNQDLFARVASAYADDQAHAQRIYDYISKLWFMPATPVLSNGGTGRGLPISCYLNSVSDSLNGIVDTWNENVWLASKGGGIGTYWGAVRGIGEPVGLNGKTSGIIPFVRVMDSLTLAISQGSLRRGSAACYLDVSHPEIEEFLEIRKPSGDFNRKALNLHHGVLLSDDFMEAVRSGTPVVASRIDGNIGMLGQDYAGYFEWGDAAALAAARGAVDAAKVALGERGPVWWGDGAPDYNRRMARGTPYADWAQKLISS